MRSMVILAGLGLALSAIGCGGPDLKEAGDEFVREELLAKFEKTEAIPFFEVQGGHYFDLDNSTTVDRDVILPLLKRLNETVPTEQWVILRPRMKDGAGALLIGLPGNAEAHERMVQVVEEAQSRFSGQILQQWGHEWLSIDLIDKEVYERVKKAHPDLKTKL